MYEQQTLTWPSKIQKHINTRKQTEHTHIYQINYTQTYIYNVLGLCLWRTGERVGSSTSNRGVSPLQREGGHGGFRVQKEVLLSSPLPFSQEEIYLHSLRPPLGLVFLVGIACSVCSTILSSDCMMNIFSLSFSVNYALGKDFI